MITFERTDTGDLQASADVSVGVETRRIHTPLGPWFSEAPDPIGLAMLPVVGFPAGAGIEVARAGALVAGRMPPVLLLPADAPTIGGQLLVARAQGVEVVLIVGNATSALRAARGLAGRPILALPLEDPAGCLALLSALDIDVTVPIPSLEGGRRGRVRAALAAVEPERRHHVVEVDPRPAYEEGIPGDASLTDLTAAAAGVLAGRLAVENRRWRASLA